MCQQTLTSKVLTMVFTILSMTSAVLLMVFVLSLLLCKLLQLSPSLMASMLLLYILHSSFLWCTCSSSPSVKIQAYSIGHLLSRLSSCSEGVHRIWMGFFTNSLFFFEAVARIFTPSQSGVCLASHMHSTTADFSVLCKRQASCCSLILLPRTLCVSLMYIFLSCMKFCIPHWTFVHQWACP